MPNPKRRHSKTRTAKRRTHDALTPATTGLCPQCHEPKAPHRICPHCGYYGTRSKVETAESGPGKARKTVKTARRVILVKEK